MSARLEQEIIEIIPLLSAKYYVKDFQQWESNMAKHMELSDKMRAAVEEGYQISNKRKCYLVQNQTSITHTKGK